MTKHECTDQTILERIKDHPGRRFQAGQMAEFYGVGSPAMRAALERLAGSGLIRRTGNYSKATEFWFPGRTMFRSRRRHRGHSANGVLIRSLWSGQARAAAIVPRFRRSLIDNTTKGRSING